MSTHVFIIAEAGVNHNGDITMAEQLIDVAAEAGADAVKFQTFRTEQVISRNAPKAHYQTETTDREESQFDMVRNLELSAADHESLLATAKAKNIGFLSSPFDSESLRLLTSGFGLKTIKIASGEITNAPFLLEIARTGSKVIMSTGMSTLADVEAALGVLAFGYTAPAVAIPQRGDFERAFSSEAGQRALQDHATVLHCTTEYPAPFADVNLRAMDTMAVAFGLPVGYSDHTPGIHISIAAVARGARTIEKHFTLDRGLPGPDHLASVEPDELKELVRQIRDVEQAMGDGKKRPSESEWKNRDVVRRSLVASSAIRKGEIPTAENITSKRPGTGLNPFEYWRVLGQPANRDYETDELLDE